MPLKSGYNHIFLYNGGIPKKYTFRFENISFRFTIVEHFVLRIIRCHRTLSCMDRLHRVCTASTKRGYRGLLLCGRKRCRVA